MSEERRKFDDEQFAKDKIATSPDVTVDIKDIPKGQPDKQPVSMGSEPVRIVPDDPETDARNTRLFVNCLEKFSNIDSDTAGAAEDFGQAIWPLLRSVGMGWKLYTGITGVLLLAPVIPSGFKLIKGLFKKKEDQDDATGHA